MKSPLAIVGAMHEEILALKEELERPSKHEGPFADLPIFTGALEGRSIVLARCGIGKVNAALAAQYIIDRFSPTALINTGVAGGVREDAEIGDIAVGRSSIQYDFDVTSGGYSLGTIPRLAVSEFPGDQQLAALALEAAAEVVAPEKILQGLIVTGDRFVSSAAQKRAILNCFPQAVCVEMEGAAIAQVAHLNGTPHLILRAISDQADQKAHQDLREYLIKIIPILNEILKRMVRKSQ